MRFLPRAPIKRTLMATMLLTSGIVLLLAGAAFVAYDVFTFRRATAEHVTTVGKVIAANSTAALAFDNRADAEETLSSLREEQQIVVAALYDRTGRLFAAYPRTVPPGTLPERPGEDGYLFAERQLAGFQPVVQGANERLGTLYLRAGMQALYDRLRLYGGIALSVLLTSFLVAYVLSRLLQRQISEPVLALTSAARTVSERGDFSLRAPPADQPELRVLTDTFNRMLAQIQDSQSRLRVQLARLDLLQRITRAIAARQDLPSIFEVVAGSLEADLPLDLACVCRYDAVDDVLVVERVGPRSVELATVLGLTPSGRIASDANGLARCVQGALVHEPDLRGMPHAFAQRLAHAGIRSLVAAPLVIEDQVWGVLLAARTVPRSFSSGDCEFLHQLSAHVALAVHQVRLHADLQQAYDDLRQSQLTIAQQERLRALGQMASGIAHDINNAISPVALYTESLLEHENALSTRGRRYLVTIQRAIEDVAQTVARMREFYRRGDSRMATAPVDLNAVVRQMIELTSARWSDEPQERGIYIDLRAELASEAVWVTGVDAEIRDALVNLLFNAVDAMPAGGSLVVRTRTHESGEAAGTVDLEVQDSGIGMDEDTRRRCLEPFFTTKGERGTGMGLAMVYGMVQRHGAQLDIDSAPGRGTTVRLRFPGARSSAPDAGVPAATANGHRRLNVLVVDDDPLLIESLRDTLEAEGHFVTVADGGQAGIDAFVDAQARGRSVDVVITDLGMPHLDGRAVAAAVKALSPATPVILLTGWGHRLMTENDVPEHVDRVLSKPPRLKDLRTLLTEFARS